MNGELEMKRVIVKIVYTTLIIGIFSNIISQNKPTVNEVKQRIEIINKKIGEKGFFWKAGITSKSFLSEDEKKKLCGLQLDEKIDIEAIESAGDSLYKLYKMDLVSNGGQKTMSIDWINWMSEIENQECGNC